MESFDSRGYEKYAEHNKCVSHPVSSIDHAYCKWTHMACIKDNNLEGNVEEE